MRRSASHQNCLLHKTFKTGPGNTQNTFVLAVPTNGVKTTWLSLAAEKLSLCQGLVTHPSSVTDRGGLEIIYIQHRGGRSIGERLACTKLALVQLLPLNQCALHRKWQCWCCAARHNYQFILSAFPTQFLMCQSPSPSVMSQSQC